MKRSLFLAGACALALAACGGGKAQFPVMVYIDGLQYPGMVLSTNGMTVAPAPPARDAQTNAIPTLPVKFPQTLSYGDVYNVTIATQPQHQTCTIGNNNDTAGRMAAIQVVLSCNLATHKLTGTIKGLIAGNLTLTNGSTGGTFTPVAGGTALTLPDVAYGSTYGVTVLQQPTGQVCTVANGVGTMLDADVTNIVVTCVNAPA